ncbi:hypothetical protein PCL_09564 [Purpureocillium lilacinum]|uniref:SnoaL-like domain-containing protein n=1 Tax=Purpureocillium lilacinum TaxID=33203 RepID=A0A2U3DQM8_PURLI|nr:hypothetical protein PCL_09564 [Purpureocillium lilacinum]
MATQENIQPLIQIRQARLKEASEARDVDALMKWQAADTTFTDKVTGTVVSGWDAVRDHYAKIFLAMPTFRILQPETTGYTPEFVVSELECEAIPGEDMPQWGVKKGEVLRMKAISMFWWRWEGKGEWTGALDDEAISGWKIYRERSPGQIFRGPHLTQRPIGATRAWHAIARRAREHGGHGESVDDADGEPGSQAAAERGGLHGPRGIVNGREAASGAGGDDCPPAGRGLQAGDRPTAAGGADVRVAERAQSTGQPASCVEGLSGSSGSPKAACHPPDAGFHQISIHDLPQVSH